jgi:uncharacterized membrane protein
MAPLQKRALLSLIGGSIVTLALITMMIIQGNVTAFASDQGSRLFMYIALIGVPLIYLLLVNPVLRKPGLADERDRVIMDRSSRAQFLAIIFSLAAWTIALTEIYRDRGEIPTAFLNLIFMSILIIGVLAQSLGILLGYWRMNRNG